MAEALDIKAFKDKVKAMLSALPEELTKTNAVLARSALSAVRNRLQTDGVDAKGQSLGKYSTNPLPTFFFKNKGLGSGADKAFEAYVKREQKRLGKAFKGVSYEKFRELNNRPTDKVDLNFTGETLRDLDVLESTQQGTFIVTTVASKNSIKKATYNAKGEAKGSIGTEQVLEHLADRYGDILALSEKEEEDIAVAFDERLQFFIDTYLPR
jgi:hypothetical protein